MNSDFESFKQIFALLAFVGNLSMTFFIECTLMYLFIKIFLNVTYKSKSEINISLAFIAIINELLLYLLIVLFMLFIIVININDIYQFYLAHISNIDFKRLILSLAKYVAYFLFSSMSLIILVSQICVFKYERKSKSFSEHKTITKFEIK